LDVLILVFVAARLLAKQGPEERQKDEGDQQQHNIEQGAHAGVVKKAVAARPKNQHIGLMAHRR